LPMVSVCIQRWECLEIPVWGDPMWHCDRRGGPQDKRELELINAGQIREHKFDTSK
jgi:hypothetical protein